MSATLSLNADSITTSPNASASIFKMSDDALVAVWVEGKNGPGTDRVMRRYRSTDGVTWVKLSDYNSSTALNTFTAPDGSKHIYPLLTQQTGADVILGFNVMPTAANSQMFKMTYSTTQKDLTDTLIGAYTPTTAWTALAPGVTGTYNFTDWGAAAYDTVHTDAIVAFSAVSGTFTACYLIAFDPTTGKVTETDFTGTPSSDNRQPRIALDLSVTPINVWTSHSKFTGFDYRLALHTYNGATLALSVNESVAAVAPTELKQTFCCLNPDGTAQVFYVDNSYQLVTRQRTGAATYTAALVLATNIANFAVQGGTPANISWQDQFAVFVLANGDIYVFFKIISSQPNGEVYYVRRNGSTWSAATALKTGSGGFNHPNFGPIAIGSDHKLHYLFSRGAGVYPGTWSLLYDFLYDGTPDAPTSVVPATRGETSLTPTLSATYKQKRSGDSSGKVAFRVVRPSDGVVMWEYRSPADYFTELFTSTAAWTARLGTLGTVASNILTAGSTGAWLVTADAARANARWSAAGKLTSDTAEFIAVYKWTDANNYIRASVVGGATDQFQLHKFIGGVLTLLQAKTFAPTLNNWYHIDLEVRGEKVIARLYDTAQAAAGKRKKDSTLVATAYGTVPDAGVATGLFGIGSTTTVASQWGGIADGEGGAWVENNTASIGTAVDGTFSVVYAGTALAKAVDYSLVAWAWDSQEMYEGALSATSTFAVNNPPAQIGPSIVSNTTTGNAELALYPLEPITGGEIAPVSCDIQRRTSAVGAIAAGAYAAIKSAIALVKATTETTVTFDFQLPTNGLARNLVVDGAVASGHAKTLDAAATLIADSAAPSGFALKAVGTGYTTLAIARAEATRAYSYAVSIKGDGANNGEVLVEWLDTARATISTDATLTRSTGSYADAAQTNKTAPANTKYVRFKVRSAAATGVAYFSAVRFKQGAGAVAAWSSADQSLMNPSAAVFTAAAGNERVPVWTGLSLASFGATLVFEPTTSPHAADVVLFEIRVDANNTLRLIHTTTDTMKFEKRRGGTVVANPTTAALTSAVGSAIVVSISQDATGMYVDAQVNGGAWVSASSVIEQAQMALAGTVTEVWVGSAAGASWADGKIGIVRRTGAMTSAQRQTATPYRDPDANDTVGPWVFPGFGVEVPSFDDRLVKLGTSYDYRTLVTATAATPTTVTGQSFAATVNVDSPPKWFLKDGSDQTKDTWLKVIERFPYSVPRATRVVNPLAGNRKVAIKQKTPTGIEGTLRVMFTSVADQSAKETAIRALQASDATLYLQTPFGDLFAVALPDPIDFNKYTSILEASISVVEVG